MSKRNRLEKDVNKAEIDVGKGARKGWNAGKGAANNVARGVRKQDKNENK